MAIALIFTPAAMSAAQYDEIHRRLVAAGEGAPRGRIFHACHGSGDHMQVFDAWESRESFERFAGTLIPILGEVGVDPGEPRLAEIHYLAAGELPATQAA